MQALHWWINGTIARVFAYWRNHVALETLHKQIVRRIVIEHIESLLQSVFKAWRGHMHSKVHRKQQRTIALFAMTNYRLCLIFDTWLVLSILLQTVDDVRKYVS